MRKLSNSAIIFCLVIASAIFAQKKGSQTISLSVRDVNLDKVLRIISDKSGLSFIPDPAISNKKITTELSETDPEEALRIIAQLYGLGFKELGTSGKYVVTDLKSIEVPTVLGFYTCEFAPASDMIEVIKNFLTPDVGTAVVDSRTNTLIYQDTPDNIANLNKIARTLDKSTRQIYIKSVIVEVTINKDTDSGVQWFAQGNNYKAGTNFGIKPSVQEMPLIIDKPSGTGLGIGILDVDIDVAISMLSTTNDLNLLSTPYLVTLDNQWAQIEVGDQIPFQKLNEFGVTSYEFKDATIKLGLLPHINNDSTITIQIQPQANFQQGFTPDGVPIISTRKAMTQVMVESGETVVIGGIMQESDVTSETSVPFLGSLPLLGRLFKSSKISRQKTELIVMLMPEIVDIDLTRLTEEVSGELPENLRKKLK